MQAGELGQARDGSVRPATERLADPRLERIVAGEQFLGLGPLAGSVQADSLTQVSGLTVDANTEVERERRQLPI